MKDKTTNDSTLIEKTSKVLGKLFARSLPSLSSAGCPEEVFSNYAENFLLGLPKKLRSQNANYTDPMIRRSEIEQRWMSFVKRKIAEPYTKTLSQEECSKNLPVFILSSQRNISLALKKLNERVYYDLVSRKPVSCFPFSELRDAADNGQESSPNYFDSLRNSLTLELEECPQELLMDRFESFFLSLKSPERDLMESLDLKEQQDNAPPASISQLLFSRLAAHLELRSDQYQERLLANFEILPPIFSEQLFERLIVFYARERSRLFFSRLPGWLLKDLKEAKPEDYQQYGAAFSEYETKPSELLTLEFPELEEEAILLGEIENIKTRLEEESFVDDSENEELRNYLSVLLTQLEEILEEGFRNALWDLKQSHDLISYLPQIKETLAWDNDRWQQEYGALHSFRDAQTALLPELQTAVSALGKEIEELGQDKIEPTFAAKAPFPAVTARKYALKRSAVLNELLATLEEIAHRTSFLSKDTEEVDLKEYVSALYHASCKVLAWGRENLVDPTPLLSLPDPIGSSYFEVPDHTSPLGQEIQKALDSDAIEQVKRRYPEKLVLAAAISQDLSRGESLDSIKNKFPKHLVDAVLLREMLWRGRDAIEEMLPDDAHRKMLFELLRQQAQIDEYAEAHCKNLSHFYEELLQEFLITSSPPPAYDLALRAGAIELVWHWYFSRLENLYETPQRRALDIPGIEEKKALFPSWAVRQVGETLLEHDSPFGLLLVLRKPASVFSPEDITDINSSESPERQTYVRLITSLLVKELEQHDPKEHPQRFLAFFPALKAPYRDIFEENRYVLYGFVNDLYRLRPEQARRFPAALRKVILEHWVELSESYFHGSPGSAGRLYQMLVGCFEKENPHLLREALTQILDEALNQKTDELNQRYAEFEDTPVLYRTATSLDDEISELMLLKRVLESLDSKES